VNLELRWPVKFDSGRAVKRHVVFCAVRNGKNGPKENRTLNGEGCGPELYRDEADQPKSAPGLVT
jgi:hypothetical protein